MDLYAENILDHFKNPHHCGVLDDPSASAKEVNPLCGDKYEVQLKLKNDVIVDAAFSGEGCAISKAAISMLMDEVIGKPIEEVEKIDKERIYELLGVDISAARVKCALIGLNTLKKAIQNYAQGQ